MKRLLYLTLFVFLNSNLSLAKDVEPGLASAYLQQWFSIDSKHNLKLSLGKLEEDETSFHQAISFTSDDGQAVNGRLGLPTTASKGQRKLALLLHPMGVDQSFWWLADHAMQASKITKRLRDQGYTVVSLDARLHGERALAGFGPRELIARARSAEPRIYLDAIIGSVRDYRLLKAWAVERFKPSSILVAGYSMGAQMSILLAAQEPDIDQAIVMVPPFVDNHQSPVAPRVHTPNLKVANVLWLAANSDQFSSRAQTKSTFASISSDAKALHWFDSGHRLPLDYVEHTLAFIEGLDAVTKIADEGVGNAR